MGPFPVSSMREAIDRHCDVVRRTVVEKLLPLARTNPVTGHPTVHMAFWGDSHSHLQYIRTVLDLSSCLKDGWSSSIMEPHPTASSRTEFGGRVVFLQNPVPNNDDKGQRDSASHPIRILITYHRAVYALRVVSALQRMYEVGGGVLTSPGRRTKAAPWPSSPLAPAAQVLYVSVGAWDVVLSKVDMDGHGPQYGELLFSPPGQPTWPEKLVAFDRFLQRKLTNPVRSLVTRWRSGQWNNYNTTERRSVRSTADVNVSPFRPPEYFFFVHPPNIVCNACPFNCPERTQAEPQYRPVLGFPRCNGLSQPAGEILRRHFDEALRPAEEAPGNGVDGLYHNNGTQVRFADSNDYRDVCDVKDGVHITDSEPLCRERLLLAFWELFGDTR